MADVSRALGNAGESEQVRNAIFELLRQMECSVSDPLQFRKETRWPLISALLSRVGRHRVVLKNGLIFEVGVESRIEYALLMSRETHPDHVWEPQTTRLLGLLAEGVAHIIVGGAYIGDHVLPLARSSAQSPPTMIHAFEPEESAYARLVRNLEINDIHNVLPHRLGLWDRSNVGLKIAGRAPLASAIPLQAQPGPLEAIQSVTIDDYVRTQQIASVGLVMLDTEGCEERALHGASDLLLHDPAGAPNIVFEIHRDYVDWSNGLENTAIVRFLMSHDYIIFAIRDFHDNFHMADHPIEIIPVDRVYLEGPPHGFNVLATKDRNLPRRLGLREVADVSPKLLLHKDPALHHPIF